MLTRFSLATLFFTTAALTVAHAAPTAVGRYKDWTVFTETVNGETLCYAATEATDKAPRSADHGDVWFFVSNWRSGKARSQPSLKVGYELRADLPGRASIGRSGWTLYGVGREAFAQDRDDSKIVSALKKGSELRVEAVSARDTKVSYHFSLSGSAAAIDKASSACR
ncbi:invasion associated locus B family protein [Henriciella sp. AS95]|uniref:invasion associated locus B family protein n=1 Tax=Henriciella sp. AS95 TaxID=3135782 RepID=UPI00317AADF4